MRHQLLLLLVGIALMGCARLQKRNPFYQLYYGGDPPKVMAPGQRVTLVASAGAAGAQSAPDADYRHLVAGLVYAISEQNAIVQRGVEKCAKEADKLGKRATAVRILSGIAIIGGGSTAGLIGTSAAAAIGGGAAAAGGLVNVLWPPDQWKIREVRCREVAASRNRMEDFLVTIRYKLTSKEEPAGIWRDWRSFVDTALLCGDKCLGLEKSDPMRNCPLFVEEAQRERTK